MAWPKCYFVGMWQMCDATNHKNICCSSCATINRRRCKLLDLLFCTVVLNGVLRSFNAAIEEPEQWNTERPNSIHHLKHFCSIRADAIVITAVGTKTWGQTGVANPGWPHFWGSKWKQNFSMMPLKMWYNIKAVTTAQRDWREKQFTDTLVVACTGCSGFVVSEGLLILYKFPRNVFFIANFVNECRFLKIEHQISGDSVCCRTPPGLASQTPTFPW